MTRTPDEIKKGLMCLSHDRTHTLPCSACEYHGQGLPPCRTAVHEDAIALIQQLEAQNAEKDERNRRLEAERDAAVRDLTEMAQDTDESCEYCEMFKTPHCSRECRMKNKGFKWRGVKKEA